MENILETLSTAQVLQSLEAELAKASNEVKCAEADLSKAKNRLKFALTLVHHIKSQETNNGN